MLHQYDLICYLYPLLAIWIMSSCPNTYYFHSVNCVLWTFPNNLKYQSGTHLFWTRIRSSKISKNGGFQIFHKKWRKAKGGSSKNPFLLDPTFAFLHFLLDYPILMISHFLVISVTSTLLKLGEFIIYNITSF